MKADYHQPALLKESIDLLVTQESGTYVDVTFGGGGHSREILRRLGPAGKLIAFDKDVDAHQNKIEDPRLLLVKTDFKFIDTVLDGLGNPKWMAFWQIWASPRIKSTFPKGGSASGFQQTWTCGWTAVLP